MKKFELTYTSDLICSIATVISVFWVHLMVGVFMVFPNIATIVLMFIVPIFLIAITIYCMNKKTVVEYDAEKIQWKWLWFTHMVNFNKMCSVHYTIVNKYSRYRRPTRLVEIVFTMNDGKKLRLNNSLTIEYIESSVKDTPDNIKFMELYKFIENIYPEKCSGFVKSNNIF
ncbi:MAG: hypothetical protein NC040_06595 [Muribaculaceae bacterium]|nr:hypothetical protein [Alistipes senegalensis]MCM1473708.1 hypothetical protein [Muribaculaceae bacterium]